MKETQEQKRIEMNNTLELRASISLFRNEIKITVNCWVRVTRHSLYFINTIAAYSHKRDVSGVNVLKLFPSFLHYFEKVLFAPTLRHFLHTHTHTHALNNELTSRGIS